MALFVVNRYLGEENEVETNSNKDIALNTLIDKIEERRKRKLKDVTGENISDSDDNSSKCESISNKSKKIKIDYTESTLNSNLKNENKKSTKKKKRKSDTNKKTSSDHGADEIGLANGDPVELAQKMINRNEETNEKLNLNGLDSKNPDFFVIGGHNFKHKKSIKYILPEWISRPITISSSLQDCSVRVKTFPGLDKTLISNLKNNKIKHLFPVQQKVIPWVLKESRCSSPGLRLWPRDICVSAPTGSGKTLAFVLPIVQHLMKRSVKNIRALVVVPVQDLAAQVAQVFKQYTVGTGLHVLSVTGKQTPLQQEQKLLVYKKAGGSYQSLVDIMVTTPGRLVEHLKETTGFSLHNLKFLVIDEADRVIDNIKNDWLYHLENHISDKGIGATRPLSLNNLKENFVRPQKLLFSATLTQDPEKLKQINLFQPRLFICKCPENNDNTNKKSSDTSDDLLSNQVMKPVELEEQWIECNPQLKPLIFFHILVEKNWRGVLCFTHFNDATHRLTRLLHHLSKKYGLNLIIEEISSEKSFNDRHRILKDFRSGKVDVLVCSDVYSRGMDILDVRYVVLYSPPVFVRNYVHQVGRTARAGMKGTALTLLTSQQINLFHKMLKGTNHSNLLEIKINESALQYLEEPYKKALKSLKKETMKEKEHTKESIKTTKRKNFMQHNRKFKKNFDNKKKDKRSQIKSNKNNLKSLKRKGEKISE